MTRRGAGLNAPAGGGAARPGGSPQYRVLGIAGSLRRGSWNRLLLEAASRHAPEGLDVEIADIAELPLYNADLDGPDTRPASVQRLRDRVAAADGLLIATPEYNHSVPGVLQNAIDWLSRPAMRSPLAGKPAGVIGAAVGALGAARAQQQLKLVLMSTLAPVMPHPGVAVGNAAERFGADGRLVHEPTQRFLAAYLEEFTAWCARFPQPGQEGRPRRVA